MSQDNGSNRQPQRVDWDVMARDRQWLPRSPLLTATA